MNKIISFSLALLMVLLPFASCSESNVNSGGEINNQGSTPTAESDVETEEETKRFLDDMPEQMDFGGRAMNFIVEEGGNGNLSELSVIAEEDSGDVVESAVYNRNFTVCERLNISINLVDVLLGGNQISPLLAQSVTAGTNDYDIIGVYQYYGIGIAADGRVHNLNKLPYLDFTREYWGSDYISDMSYRDATFWATGDIALRYIGGMYVTYVNDAIWEDNYYGQNIYDTVNEGSWTLDKITELSQNVYTDVNGNGKQDMEDIYGFAICYEDPVDGIVAGSDIHFSEKNDEGVPFITLNNEHTYNFFDKLYKLVRENNSCYIATNDDNKTLMTMFSTGNVMFAVNKLFQSAVFLRDMEQAFKIIPVPKYDENQENYITRLHDSVTCFGVPITNLDYEVTGATLEALASESNKLVAPAYYETALKVKYTRDSESGMMIDLIREHATSDFASLYSANIGNIVHFFRSQLSGNGNISSAMKSNEKIWNKSIEKLITKMEENVDK